MEYGANPNAGDMWSFTPLHEAILKNRGEVCSLLLSYKAQPYLQNCYKKTSFELAFEQQQNADLLEKLVFEYLGYALLDAINENNFLKVKFLLDSNIHQDIKMNLREDLVSDYLHRYDEKASCQFGADKKGYFKRLANFKHCRTSETPLVIFRLIS